MIALPAPYIFIEILQLFHGFKMAELIVGRSAFKSGFGRDSAGSFFGTVDGLQGRIERVGDPVCAHKCESVSKAEDSELRQPEHLAKYPAYRAGSSSLANAVVCPSKPQLSTRAVGRTSENPLLPEGRKIL